MAATLPDPDPVLSTTEVGELFDVHPSTVKRWCDRGKLRSRRTEGGHRRIPLSEALRQAREDGVPLPLGEFGGKAGSVWEACRSVIDRHEYGPALALVEEWLESWCLDPIGDLVVHLGRQGPVDLAGLFDDGVRSLMGAAGERWEEGRLGVGHEHLLSETMVDALHRLRRIPTVRARRTDDAPVALVGCAEGERHDLGARCVRIVLERRGWSVRFLGCDVPMDEWSVVQRESRAALVCVSFSSMRTRADVLRCFRRLSDGYDPGRSHLLALGGGAAIEDTLPGTWPFRDVRYFSGIDGFADWLASHDTPSSTPEVR